MVKIILKFTVLSSLIILLNSCEKINDIIGIDKKEMLLIEENVKYEYLSISNSACYRSEYIYRYEYDEKNNCTTIYSKTIFKDNCSPVEYDTTFYSKSGNSIYVKYGKNYPLTLLGILNNEGNLESSIINNQYLERLTPKNILGIQYNDTSGSGYTQVPNTNGTTTESISKSYLVIHQNRNTYPISKQSRTVLIENKKKSDGTKLIESESIETINDRIFQKNCSNCNWTFINYVPSTLRGKTVLNNNLKIKQIVRNFYNEIERPSFNAYWNTIPSYIKLEEQRSYSYSENGITYSTIYTGNLPTAKNIIMEEGKLKSFQSIQNTYNTTDGTAKPYSIATYTYTYKKK